jgi:hypothetical protein
MGATNATVDHFANVFCLVIPWLLEAYENIYDQPILLVEADEDTGRIVLLGNPELCQQFQHEAGMIIGSTPDPKNEWRKY